MQTATQHRRLFGTTHRRSTLGTVALAQIASAITINPNFGVKTSQPLGTTSPQPTAPAYHENGGGSGGIKFNGGGSSCIGAGSGDVKNRLGKDGFDCVDRDAKDTGEGTLAVDLNVLAATSLGRAATQARMRC